MPGWKSLLVTFVVVLVSLAIINRVAFLKSVTQA